MTLIRKRAPAHAQPTSKRHTDKLRIDGGLGSVPTTTFDIRPFTVFVGRQGTGKSLVAQVLFTFEELPFLMLLAHSERGNAQLTSPQLFRWILDQLRSRDRAFATFANEKVKVTWSCSSADEWPLPPPELSFRAYSKTRGISVTRKSAQFLDSLGRQVMASRAHPIHNAIFFPTERVISQLHTAGAWSLGLDAVPAKNHRVVGIALATRSVPRQAPRRAVLEGTTEVRLVAVQASTSERAS